jgi:hypothetical protein
MGNFIAGDVLEIVCSHPTLGDFRFSPKANESFTMDRGGIRNNDDANGITSNGRSIVQKNRFGWFYEGPVAVNLQTNEEVEALDALSASTEDGVWSFSHISGAIHKGKGRPVGDQQADTNNAQLKLKVAGGGQLEKIA